MGNLLGAREIEARPFFDDWQVTNGTVLAEGYAQIDVCRRN